MNILNKLTIKHLKMNKKRTIVTIIGIILSTALMVGIGCLLSSFRDFMLEDTIIHVGRQHVTIRDINYSDYKYIDNNPSVKETFYSVNLGYSILPNSENEYKPYLFLMGVNDNYFKNTTLLEGRYPKNNNEIVISNHILTNGGVKYNVGDVIKLDVSNRVINIDGIKEELNQYDPYDPDLAETLELKYQKEVKIVGIIERMRTENYDAPGYSILTKAIKEEVNDSKMNISIIYKNPNKTHKITENILKNLGYKNIDSDIHKENANYNDSLLTFYGDSSYDNVNTSIISIMSIVLSIIAIGCIIVIYNSFAISVMERKKQFGLFSSIGATKKQLRHTVFFEAFLVALIGIVIGIISGIFGIYVVLKITSFLIGDLLPHPLNLSIYPSFIIIPIIFMIITIIISAYLPARKASKISPIEAIRLNDDIKIKKRSIKTSKLTRKLFGIEGELALKNIKRNKKKYRITILSLFISIVLFVSFSTFLAYGIGGSAEYFELRDYDLILNNYNQENIKLIDEHVLSDSRVNSYVSVNNLYGVITIPKNKIIKEASEYVFQGKNGVNIMMLDQNSYNKYKKEIGYKNDDDNTIILVNNLKVFDQVKNKALTLHPYKFKSSDKVKIIYHDNEFEFNTFVTTKVSEDLNGIINNNNVNIIVSKKTFETMLDDKTFGNLTYIKTKKHQELYDDINKMMDTGILNQEELYVYDYTKDFQIFKNLNVVIRMFLYGFITLVTLIGVTSVFNTINTSIALRRKEFAVLRSIGLTPSGFNKMIRYESLIYGLKSLLYALPVSFGVILLFHLSFSNVVSFSSIMIPWKAIIIAIISVFIITFLTMTYATNKIKRENILDAIREENI